MLTRSKRKALEAVAVAPETPDDVRPTKKYKERKESKEIKELKDLKEQIDTLQHEKAGLQMALEDATKPKPSNLLYVFRSRTFEWTESSSTAVCPIAYRNKDDAGEFLKTKFGIELKFNPYPPAAVLDLRNLATHAVMPGFHGANPQAGDTYYMVRLYNKEGTVYFGHQGRFHDDPKKTALRFYGMGVPMAGLHSYYRKRDIDYILANLPDGVKADMYPLEIA